MMTTEVFIKKLEKIHGNKYGYSLVEYKGSSEKIKIICQIHGIFEQISSYHLGGSGCSECSKNKKYTNETFIEKAKEKHCDRYDYSLVEYINITSKVKIICPDHGIFEQNAGHHLEGFGCSECVGRKKHTNKTFIEKAKEKHDDKYDYSLVEYNSNKLKVEIICPDHGIFKQYPKHHINGCGCPICGRIQSIKNETSSTEEFIKRSIEKHGNKYLYDKVVYINSSNKVEIYCKKHKNYFNQLPPSHLEGCGCKLCANENNIHHFKIWYKCGLESHYFDDFKLYVIEIFDDDEKFIKIGKTYNKIKYRMCDIKKVYNNYNILYVESTKTEAEYISRLEHHLHILYRDKKYYPSKYFAGSTECFKDIQLNDVILNVENFKKNFHQII